MSTPFLNANLLRGCRGDLTYGFYGGFPNKKISIYGIPVSSCQAKIEMSYSYQSRNVLFLRLKFNGSSSLITMFAKLELPPGMVRFGSGRFSHSHNKRRCFLCFRSFVDFPKSQGSVLIGDAYGTIQSILNDHLGSVDMILNLIEPIIVRHGEVISQRPLCLDT